MIHLKIISHFLTLRYRRHSSRCADAKSELLPQHQMDEGDMSHVYMTHIRGSFLRPLHVQKF